MNKETDINKLIHKYDNLRDEGYSCGVYGGVFDYYISDKLNIEYRTSKFHLMSDSWTSFLWRNDKDNILTTINQFIKEQGA